MSVGLKTIVFRDIGAEQSRELLSLYEQEQWSNYTNDVNHIHEMVKNSTYTIGAYDEDLLVGFIRGFSDKYSINFIQDLIVKDTHKRKGIGSLLMEKAICRFPVARKTVLLTDDQKDTKSFYQSCGFSLMENLFPGKCFLRTNE